MTWQAPRGARLRELSGAATHRRAYRSVPHAVVAPVAAPDSSIVCFARQSVATRDAWLPHLSP